MRKDQHRTTDAACGNEFRYASFRTRKEKPGLGFQDTGFFLLAYWEETLRMWSPS